jgi:hypothetical protein
VSTCREELPVPVSAEFVLDSFLLLGREILGVECAPDDSFFARGGDSLQATRLAALAAERHGWTFSARDVFALETFRGVAGLVHRQLRSEDAPVQRSGRVRTAAPHNLWHLEVEGALEPDVLRLAVNDLVNRHESLRVRYEGHPIARPAALRNSLEPPVSVLSGTHLTPQHVAAWIRRESAVPLDLNTAPHVRVLFAPRETRSTLVVIVARPVCDPESMRILVRDLAFAYGARRKGGPPVWPRPAEPYSAFLRTLQVSPASGAGIEQGGVEQILQRRLPKAEVHHAARALGGDLRSLCAVAALLVSHRLGGSDSPALSISVSDRPAPWADSVGSFERTAFLHVTVEAGQSLRELAGKLDRGTVIGPAGHAWLHLDVEPSPAEAARDFAGQPAHAISIEHRDLPRPWPTLRVSEEGDAVLLSLSFPGATVLSESASQESASYENVLVDSRTALLDAFARVIRRMSENPDATCGSFTALV